MNQQISGQLRLGTERQFSKVLLPFQRGSTDVFLACDECDLYVRHHIGDAVFGERRVSGERQADDVRFQEFKNSDEFRNERGPAVCGSEISVEIQDVRLT